MVCILTIASCVRLKTNRFYLFLLLLKLDEVKPLGRWIVGNLCDSTKYSTEEQQTNIIKRTPAKKAKSDKLENTAIIYSKQSATRLAFNSSSQYPYAKRH